jgi:hypothetical protein
MKLWAKKVAKAVKPSGNVLLGEARIFNPWPK